jgi:radical SAM superfamily enzyme YgiQ (UPF0313 family)
MSLRTLSLIRPNIGDFRSSDAMTPLSLGILAARTPEDIDVRLFDDRLEIISEEDTPDLVAFTVETFTARRAYQLADRYRAKGVPVVMGGYHPTFLPDEALLHADAVVVGDAEGAWEQVLADASAGRLQKRYQGDGSRSLDDYVLDRGIFAGKRYAPIQLVQYARGCRFACDFCSIRAFYQDSVRRRNAQRVAAEVEGLNPRGLFFFVDDNLFGSKQALLDLLDAIRPIGIRWTCQISIDVAKDEHLLDRMAEAGCMLALIGFESLTESNLRQMGKGWNKLSGDYLRVVRRFHERSIAIYGTFVFGYDDDTAETLQASLDFAMEARLELANFNPLTPTPGSPLYDRLKAEGRLLYPQWWLDPTYHYGDPIFVPRKMDPETFAQGAFQLKKAFYSWPSMARRVLGSETGFDWFRTGMVGLANLISRREVYRKQNRLIGA